MTSKARLVLASVALTLFAIPAASLRAQTDIIQNLSPPRATAGGPSFTLSVLATYYESGFGPGSTLLWNGIPRPTSTEPCPLPRVAILDCIQATIPASDIASPGAASVSVLNAGRVTNNLTFTIDPPGQVAAVPTLSRGAIVVFGLALALAGVLAVSRGLRP